MTSEEIRMHLFVRRKKVNMRKIAIELGVSPTAVHLVVNRKSKSSRIMQAVADAIDYPIEEVFPEIKKAS